MVKELNFSHSTNFLEPVWDIFGKKIEISKIPNFQRLFFSFFFLFKLSVFQHSFGAIDGDLIISFISVFDTEIVNVQIAINVRENEFFLDNFPNDSGHLITLNFDDWS